jgi:hypothetical protein
MVTWGNAVSLLLICLLTLALALITGCASNSVSKPNSESASPACVSKAGANVQVPLLVTSDAALGPLLAFELKIDSVTLTGSCGNTVALLDQPLTVEWTHVNGSSEPLLLASVPADTYTGATVTYENPNIAYLWPTKTDFVSNEVTTGMVSGQVDFPSPITIGTGPSSILLDALLTQPLIINSKTNTVSPAFQVSQQAVAANPTIDTNGKEGLRGLAASISSMTAGAPLDELTVVNQAGVSIPIATNSSTQYQGLSGLAALPAGAPVDLDVATQADGSLLATRVQVENPAAWGAWVGPLVVTYPQGASEEVVPRQWEESSNMAQSYANFPSYFALTGGTRYEMYGGAIDLVNLPFSPQFAAFADTALGQGLSVSYATQQTAASQSLTQAQTTTLIPRNFSGTVSAIDNNGSSVTYTLTLAPNDLMSVMSGTTSITAYTNDGTQMETSEPLAVGSTVNMHGLLFNDGGTLKLVCDQVRMQGGV